jgi:hypothetical protein
LRIFPPEVEISTDEGFSKEKDIFQRASFGAGLMDLLTRIEHPLVMVLDGEWGSGKTVFVRMWAGLLRSNGLPVIYFDAYANDYLSDAFTALTGEVVSLARTKKVGKGKPYQRFVKSAGKVAKVLLRAGAKIGVKAATVGAINSTDLEELSAVGDDIASESSDIVDKALKARLEGRDEERNAFAQFKDALTDLATSLADESPDDGGSNKPLVFVIDELDRCRPPFALEILEKIKHIFSVPNVHFVLVTHLRQLEDSVRHSYGAGIDAKTYLQKFYHLQVHLPAPSVAVRSTLSSILLEHCKRWIPDDEVRGELTESALDEIARIAEEKGLSLRTVERIATNFALAVGYTGKNTLRLSVVIATLCVLKVVEPALYLKAKAGKLRFEEIQKFINLDAENRGDDRELWMFCLEPNLPADFNTQSFNSLTFRYNLRDRFAILPAMAKYVIDRFTAADSR